MHQPKPPTSNSQCFYSADHPFSCCAARKHNRPAFNKTDACDILKHLLHTSKLKILGCLQSQGISGGRWLGPAWIGWILNCSITPLWWSKTRTNNQKTKKKKEFYYLFIISTHAPKSFTIARCITEPVRVPCFGPWGLVCYALAAHNWWALISGRCHMKCYDVLFIVRGGEKEDKYVPLLSHHPLTLNLRCLERSHPHGPPSFIALLTSRRLANLLLIYHFFHPTFTIIAGSRCLDSCVQIERQSASERQVAVQRSEQVSEGPDTFFKRRTSENSCWDATALWCCTNSGNKRRPNVYSGYISGYISEKKIVYWWSWM